MSYKYVISVHPKNKGNELLVGLRLRVYTFTTGLLKSMQEADTVAKELINPETEGYTIDCY